MAQILRPRAVSALAPLIPALLLALALACAPAALPPSEETGAIDRAHAAMAEGVEVTGEGVVVKLLRDDTHGSRHQRFIVEIDSGLTLLIAHNIDLAERVPLRGPGDQVRFHGDYEWNHKGGVVHWTHHDPRGRRSGGWIEYEGIRYR